MSDSKRFAFHFDLFVLRVLRGILGLGIIAAVADLVWLMVHELRRTVSNIETIDEFQTAVQALFSGILLVVLGLELMDTLRNYFIEHRLRVELLLSVALIAIARHVIQLDYEHAPPLLVIGIACLIFSLAASYVVVRIFVSGGKPVEGQIARRTD
jgi:uncharacterized membrane protein (DUF373 family)